MKDDVVTTVGVFVIFGNLSIIKSDQIKINLSKVLARGLTREDLPRGANGVARVTQRCPLRAGGQNGPP